MSNYFWYEVDILIPPLGSDPIWNKNWGPPEVDKVPPEHCFWDKVTILKLCPRAEVQVCYKYC